MEIINNPSREQWQALTARNIPADDPAVEQAVEQVIEAVRIGGDKALRAFASQFDHAEITDLQVSEAEIDAACAQVPEKLKQAIAVAAKNIAAFHAAQRLRPIEVETMPGVRCVQRQVAIDTVGLYVPGGRAPLFSTVLMLALPARIAGCRQVVLCTPQSGEHPIAPAILYAARLCGVHKIFRVGGAQAIAAMALGTESIPQVDKIFGPGNRYVTKAKQRLSTVTAIDMPAGPSEVLVMADNSADPAFVASDMLSQAEHGPDSQAMLVCDSIVFAAKVEEQVKLQAARLARAESVAGSLSHSRIVVLPALADMVAFSNLYAPEHLILSVAQPWQVAEQITAAGSVFIGNYSPESAGDYASGTNHTLPTGAWAISYSGVNIDSFCRKITYQELTRQGLESLAPTIVAMAQAEGLDAHAAAVEIRIANHK